MQVLTHLSLFSGIGGIDLAAEWAGFRTVLFVEIDSYCRKVLKKHWPDVPIIGDIRDVTKERIMAYTISESSQVRGNECWPGSRTDDVRQSARWNDNRGRGDKVIGKSNTEPDLGKNEERTPNHSITLITGGFPCQPVSVAGKRRGKEDDRWLWPEMFRVISEIRPTWVVAENVAGLLRMGFNDCVSDLESEGYETISFLIPACGVNAPHRRDRIFIVGYSKRDGYQDRSRGKKGSQESLSTVVRLLPTPNQRDYKDRGLNTDYEKSAKKRKLPGTIGGQLNPNWVEWLMGFPIGWTDLNV